MPSEDPPQNQPDPQSPPAPPSEPGEAPETYEVKTPDGVARVTREELISGYAHNAAAEAKMRQAAETRKATEKDTRIADLARRMFEEDDPAALRDLALQYGKSPEEVDTVMKMLRQNPAPEFDTEDGSGTDGQQYAPIGMDDLDPALQREILELRQSKQSQDESALATMREKIFSETQKRLDDDPVLGTIKDEQVRKMISEDARDLVQLKVGIQREPWPGVLEPVVQRLRARYANASNRGPAGDGVSDISGIGPTAAMASGPSTTKPVDSVSMLDPGYSANFRQRLAHKIATAVRGRPR